MHIVHGTFLDQQIYVDEFVASSFGNSNNGVPFADHNGSLNKLNICLTYMLINLFTRGFSQI